MASSAIEADRPKFASRTLFVAAIFAGSFLLFLTQPMIARIVLLLSLAWMMRLTTPLFVALRHSRHFVA